MKLPAILIIQISAINVYVQNKDDYYNKAIKFSLTL
jgi:hypothetical protein